MTSPSIEALRRFVSEEATSPAERQSLLEHVRMLELEIERLRRSVEREAEAREAFAWMRRWADGGMLAQAATLHYDLSGRGKQILDRWEAEDVKRNG